MNGKLISLEDFNPSNIILKPPTPAGGSEIWYLTDNGNDEKSKSVAVRPIFKTPRLPLKFGAKRFSDDSNYGYCLNMSNKDIDPETGEFFQFVKSVDRALINAFTDQYKKWPSRPTSCLKYRTAMKRKTNQDDFYFQIKLVHSVKGGPLATVIYDSNRVKVGPEEINYGKYADQFISPAYLYYDESGIHPVWQAHQIVLSRVERVFLEECILDHVFKPAFIPQFNFHPPPPPPPPPNSHPHLPSSHLPPAPIIMLTPKLSINPLELKKAIQGLKKTQARNEDSSSSGDEEDSSRTAHKIHSV
jgi:hypothetical protein